MMLFDQSGLLHVIPSNRVAIVDSVDLVILAADGPVVVRGGIVRGGELSVRGQAALERHGLLSSLFDAEAGEWYLEDESDSVDVRAALDMVADSATRLDAPVADYCCGVGRLSVPLLEKGIRVCGIDMSESAVGTARDTVASRNLGRLFDPFVADVAAFARPAYFGGAIAAANSLRYLGSRGRIRRHLRLAGLSLLPGARYLIEVDTFSEPGGATWTIPNGEMSWHVLSVDTFAQESLERVTVRDGSGNVVHQELQSQVAITSDVLVDAAAQGGLRFVDAWDKTGRRIEAGDLARQPGNIWYAFEREPA